MLIAALTLALPALQVPVVLAELPESLALEGAQTHFAPGGRAAVMVFPDGELDARKWKLWQDGELGEGYDFLNGVRFSADGKSLAYRRGQVIEGGSQRWEVVLNGRADGSYTWVGPPALRPDGREVAYWAGEGVTHAPQNGVTAGSGPGASGRTGGSYFIVQAGQEAKDRYPSTPERYAPVYRADGKEIAHLALLEDGLFVRVGKKEHGPYQDASAPVYAPEGKTCGWVGVPRSGRGAIVIGKKEYAEGAFIDNPIVGAVAGTGFAVQTMLSLQVQG